MPRRELKHMEQNEEREIIAGRNAVSEALRANRQIDTIFISESVENANSHSGLGKLRALAREHSVVVKNATVQKLNELAGQTVHQGVVAILPCAPYYTVEDILEVSKEKGMPPFIIMADEIEDPHNLGAIIRTAEACGADGLIIPKRRSAGLSATVYKTSAGAASVLKTARVPNLVACLKELKEHNIWIYGAEMEGTRWCELDFRTGGVCLVIGSEGNGLGRLIKEECDFFATLPMCGKINSLNASVAAGILMYEITRQRTQQ